mgnify:CR=1 FL=1
MIENIVFKKLNYQGLRRRFLFGCTCQRGNGHTGPVLPKCHRFLRQLQSNAEKGEFPFPFVGIDFQQYCYCFASLWDQSFSKKSKKSEQKGQNCSHFSRSTHTKAIINNNIYFQISLWLTVMVVYYRPKYWDVYRHTYKSNLLSESKIQVYRLQIKRTD